MTISRADFLVFVRRQRIYTELNGEATVMSLSTGNIADNDPDIDTALAWALSTVTDLIQQFNVIDYERAVYNAGMHWLLMYGVAEVFDGIRTALNLWAQKNGFLQSTSDEGSSSSYLLPDYLATLSASDMDYMKTQNGRDYLSILGRYRDLVNFA